MRCLVVGFSDGVVKVYEVTEDEASTTWEPKQTINAFVSVAGKKGSVTCLKVHPESGALYGASS